MDAWSDTDPQALGALSMLDSDPWHPLLVAADAWEDAGDLWRAVAAREVAHAKKWPRPAWGWVTMRHSASDESQRLRVPQVVWLPSLSAAFRLAVEVTAVDMEDRADKKVLAARGPLQSPFAWLRVGVEVVRGGVVLWRKER